MARGAGAVLSFETGNVKVSERIVESTRIWGISVSFGCVNSLIRYIHLKMVLIVVCLVKCLMLPLIRQLEPKEHYPRI